MTQTLNNSFSLLKDRQEGMVNNALSTFTSVYSRFPEKEGLTGKKTVRAIRHARPAGFALGPGADSLPVAGRTKYSNTKIYPAFWYQTLSADWDLTELSSNEQGAFASIISDVVEAASESAVMCMERMSVGDGSGRLGTVNTVTSTAGNAFTFTVSDTDNQAFFEEGELIQFMYDTTTGGTLEFNQYSFRTNPSAGWYEIDTVSVNETTNLLTITCSSDSLHPAANPPLATDTVIVAQSIIKNAVNGTHNAGNELNGLDILIDDGDQPVLTSTADTYPAVATFQGIASSNYWWQSKIENGSGQYLNRTLAHRVGSKIANHGGGNGPEDIQWIVAHSFQIDKYLETLYPSERFGNDGSTGKFTSGSTSMFRRGEGPMLGEKKTIKNKFMKKSKVFFCGPGMEKLTRRPWGFYTNDGNVWRPDPAGRPRDVAYAYAYLQLCQMRRNQSGKIENLKTS